MPAACPKCGSRYLRPSRTRNFSERLARLRLQFPLRCLDCRERFFAPGIIWEDLLYARCPVCRRMDLNFWTGKTYTDPPFRVAFKVILRAKKWRCEYCRLNFASFRKRKEVFSFKRWKRFGQQAEEHAPHPGAEQDKKKIAGDKIASATKCVQGSRHD
jgi:DNA-directed RNA polymerase subunit RPC12/RpoP